MRAEKPWSSWVSRLKVEVEETTFCQRLELVEQRSKNASWEPKNPGQVRFQVLKVEVEETSALPELINFRVPDPELDRELGTYNGGN